MDFSFKQFLWQNFGFEDYALLSLALLVILFLLFEYFPGRNYFYSLNSLKKLIDKHLIPHLLQGSENRKASYLRMIVVSFIWILLVLALANPRWDYEEVQGFEPNINMVILLDISKSMDASDEKPSRLERAKQEITDIIKKAEATNIGIIAFANQAHIISPLTDDKNALMYLLPSINTDLVGVQGSNISAGIKSAQLLLKPMGGNANYLLVVSDGGFEDAKKINSLKSSMDNVKIITMSVGKADGAPIPNAKGKFIKEDGKTIISKLEKENLIKLSGLERYIQSSYMGDDTQKVLKIVASKIDIIKQKTRLQKIWHDRFYIPLLLAALLLLPFFRKGALFPVIIIMLFANPFSAVAQTKEIIENVMPQKSKLKEFFSEMFLNDDQQAEDFYDDRQYKEAEEKYAANYNKGVSAFRQKDYASAEENFIKDAATNLDSEYNMGNSQLLQMKIKDAIKTYESVLKKDPNHEDAKNNLEIAKKLLQNPKNKNKDKSESDKQDKKDQDKDNNGKQDNKDLNNQDKKGDDKSDKGDKKDDKNQGQGGDKDQQNQQGGENNENPQETDGNNSKKELDIQAKSILSKISSDPEKLMKGRFEYEENKSGGAKSENNKKPKPW